MQNRKGIVYPRIAEEVVDYDELLPLWECSYMTAYRILYGLQHPNHKRKKALSDYLGIPVEELFKKVDPNAAPEVKAVAQTDTPTENSEIISEFTSSEV